MKRVNWHIPEAAGVNVWPNVPPTRGELTSRVMSHRNFCIYLSVSLSVCLSVYLSVKTKLSIVTCVVVSCCVLLLSSRRWFPSYCTSLRPHLHSVSFSTNLLVTLEKMWNNFEEHRSALAAIVHDVGELRSKLLIRGPIYKISYDLP